MANKFGKFLLFSAAAGAVAAGTYYFLKNKDKFLNKNAVDDDDEDYDDFSDDLDDESERSYVPLNTEVSDTVTDFTEAVADKAEDIVSSVSEQAEEAAETIEEFFDEDDSSNE